MIVAGINRLFLNPNEENTLNQMARDGPLLIDDMEEGEISDSESVEEISEQDFVHEAGALKPKAELMDWMRLSGNYSGNLANLAWMQAVKNKPLADIFVKEDVSAEGNVRTSDRAVTDDQKGLPDKKNEKSMDCVVNVSDDSGDEVEKEEGELEEGELLETEEYLELLDAEVVDKSENTEDRYSNSNKLSYNNLEKEFKERDFERQVNSVKGILRTVTVRDAEISFHGVCSQIRNAMEILKQVISESRVPSVDDLIEKTFAGIKTLHSVFRAGNLKQQELYRDSFLRFLSNAKDQSPSLFSLNQIKEIEVMMLSNSGSTSLNIRSMEKEKEISNLNASVNLIDGGVVAESTFPGHVSPEKARATDSDSSNILSEKLSASNFRSGTVSMDKHVKLGSDSSNISLEKAIANTGTDKTGRNCFESLKLEPLSKGKADFGPLLNVHVDYDINSLPSPTREEPLPVSVQKPQSGVDGLHNSHLMSGKQQEEVADGASLHPYVTDALKAVSSYQQKFGRSSFFMSDKLPSPTPSDESDNMDEDFHGEVSSAAAVGSVKTVNSSIPLQASTVNYSIPPQASTVNSSIPLQASTVNSSIPLQASTVNTGTHMSGSSSMGRTAAKNTGVLDPGTSPNWKSSFKSRDPRLRNALSGSTTMFVDLNNRPLTAESNASKKEVPGGIPVMKKHSVAEDSVLDGHTVKKQKTGSTDSSASRDPRVHAGLGGWLEDSSSLGAQPGNRDQSLRNMDIVVRKAENGDTAAKNIADTNAASQQLPVASTVSSVVSLPSLLKELTAVNPTMLLKLIQMEQQRLVAGTQPKCSGAICPPSTTLPVPTFSGNIVSAGASELIQRPAKPQIPSQTCSPNSPNEWGKVRMKPRDPRRILQNNMVQESPKLGSDQFKTDGPVPPLVPGIMDTTTVREQTDQASTCLPAQSSQIPDIAPQFTSKLKNIAQLVSGSQLNSIPLTVPESGAKSLMCTADKLDAQSGGGSQDQPNGSDLSCGENREQPQNPWGDLELLLEGYDDRQRAVIQKERARRIEEQSKMFAAGKLCLVLDLDHTLLNSAKFVEVDPVHDEILRKKEEQDREKSQRHLFRFPHMGMWTKLRPGIWNFLEKASKLFELHLYTMGNKLYATEMAKVLDPSGALFAGRVISRGDDGDSFDADDRIPKSKDLDGVLGMESAVVIIDDSVRVWPHNRHNLILVERYTYFPCSRRQFGLLGPSLLEIDHDERPEDGTLASSLAVIERIHQIFFSHPCLDDVDVRNILAAEQQKILSGCRIVFSRIFPVGEANPQLHPLWKTAEQFGAVCTLQIDDQVTHVVANSLGTDKVNWALSTGRFVVHPGWVEASALLYRRANERDFAVKI
ncbi:RNA polymerase II C-terminal domain phosphatase-like 3 [Aristolochia californica]|uniref:RNA polymerase II C-terminal domain phosphatase-like 3 n=1 Tax=Aristolochia californica TaxID=171875 RepID=UPI0035D7A90B